MSRSDSIAGRPSPPRPRRWTRHLRWRREQLLAAGFDELSAHRLAANGAVDLHTALIQKESSAEADVDRSK